MEVVETAEAMKAVVEVVETAEAMTMVDGQGETGSVGKSGQRQCQCSMI